MGVSFTNQDWEPHHGNAVNYLTAPFLHQKTTHAKYPRTSMSYPLSNIVSCKTNALCSSSMKLLRTSPPFLPIKIWNHTAHLHHIVPMLNNSCEHLSTAERGMIYLWCKVFTNSDLTSDWAQAPTIDLREWVRQKCHPPPFHKKTRSTPQSLTLAGRVW